MLRLDIDRATDLWCLSPKRAADRVSEVQCWIKFGDTVVGKTAVVSDQGVAFFRYQQQLSANVLGSKERDNMRPFFLESLEFEIVEISKAGLGDSTNSDKIGEARLSLSRAGESTLKIVPTHAPEHPHLSQAALLSVTLSFDDVGSATSQTILEPMQLSNLLSPSAPQHTPLFLSFYDISASSIAGIQHALPGPLVGEKVLDRRADVEVSGLIFEHSDSTIFFFLYSLKSSFLRMSHVDNLCIIVERYYSYECLWRHWHCQRARLPSRDRLATDIRS